MTKAGADRNVSAAAIRTRVGEYLNGTEATDPLVSPIFADLTGQPPLLIQAGSHEVLLDDATRLAVKAAADDVAVLLDVTPGVPHVFQAFAGILEEANAALERAAAFIESHLGNLTSCWRPSRHGIGGGEVVIGWALESRAVRGERVVVPISGVPKRQPRRRPRRKTQDIVKVSRGSVLQSRGAVDDTELKWRWRRTSLATQRGMRVVEPRCPTGSRQSRSIGGRGVHA